MKVFINNIKNEFIKQKRGFTWFVVFLMSLGTGGLAFIDVYLRYDYLMNRDPLLSSWEVLLLENHLSVAWFLILPIAVSIICALIYYVDYKDGGFKHILTLPIGKNRLYLSKWITAVVFATLMILFNCLVLIAIGKILSFPEPLNLTMFSKYIIYQFTAMLGVISLQLWLSSKTNNIIVPLAISFVGTTVSIFFAQSKVIANLIPYAYPLFTLPIKGESNSVAVKGGLIFGLLFLIIGLIQFRNKDILD